MISKKKFKKLADKHLFALEKPRNAFGRNELEVFGKEELYKQLHLYNVSQQSELLKSFADWLQGEVWNDKYDDFSDYVEDYIETL